MTEELPAQWKEFIADRLASDWLMGLQDFLAEERRTHEVFPPVADVFRALELTMPDEVRVVILGQDPYHDEGQAHGLAFSVRDGYRIPPSLRNIYQELEADLGISPSPRGDLSSWARQGVLLLNTVLTVRAHQPASHRGKGWEQLTDAIIAKLSDERQSRIFLLWGKQAEVKRELIDATKHAIFVSSHPSPLSARRGFFGSRPFSRVNSILSHAGQVPIRWEIPIEEESA